MRKPLVAILGCGPTGLLAAHACEMRKVPFVVFSKREKSRLGGAQYSHIEIPGLHDDFDQPPVLRYEVHGDEETYKAKVYGTSAVPFVSFGNVKDGLEVPAYPLVQMYDRLWERYEDRIVDVSLEPPAIHRLRKGFEITFCSVPANRICWATVEPQIPHWFREQTIRLVNTALDPNLPENTIRYDGTLDHSYYRMSNIFGVGSTEWGAHGRVPPVEGIRTINKPINTNCDCHLTHTDTQFETPFIRIGRFGAWKKGELTFHAYNRVIDILAEMGVE